MSYEKSYKKIIGVVCFLAALVLLVVVVVVMMSPKEINNSTGDNTKSIGSVECIKNTDAGAFLMNENASSSKHTIKATFRDENIDKMSYTYEADFATEEQAKTELSTLHASYNTFMGDVGLDIELLTPNFSSFGNDVVINLYATKSNMKEGLAKLLFVSADEMRKMPSTSMEEFTKIYSAKGFKCNIKN